MANKISRRDFLHSAGLFAGTTAAAAALTGCSGAASSVSTAVSEAATPAPTSTPAAEPIGPTVDINAFLEPPIPETVAAPSTTEYECDVLVIGGGFAGLNAAVAAKEAGQSVLLIDKGRPGYSGLTPWPSSFRWFDPEMGDDADTYRTCIQHGGEYLVNMDWYDVWINESKQTYERINSWGILDQFPRASDAGDYFDKKDYQGYLADFAQYDRRTKWVNVLNDNDIPYVEHTMVTNVIEQDGRVVGAVGFHVPSGAVITCHAKSVIMCMGGGSYKPTGFPTGEDTFDGEYICYNLGLPIAGKEFDDFHMTLSYAPGNTFLNNNWTYLENIWLCGGDITPETAISYATNKSKVMVLDRVTKAVNGLDLNDGTKVEDMSNQDITRRGGSTSEVAGEVRTGKNNDTMFKGDIYGAAVGMCGHLSSGVFCGLDDLVGYTGIPGLYVAGDGMNAASPTGAAYPTGVGFTSNFCSTQGYRAGQAAAEYAAGVELEHISNDRLEAEIEAINAPLNVTSGFDANWARDQLQAIMSPYWVTIVKTKESLTSTLAQVEMLRDQVLPKLMANSSHDLRMCHEVKHKVLSAELKLRAGLAREETRGLNYRADFPYRDDKNFLCYITVKKGENGTPTVSKVAVKDDWKGDTTADYAERYTYYFPGEREAKGLPEEQASTGGWGK
jgi:succinate dehydrogenase/fumarate reductase flavoprotein subunit